MCWEIKPFSLLEVQKLKPPKVFLKYEGPPSPSASAIDSRNSVLGFRRKRPFWLGEDGMIFFSFKFGKAMYMPTLYVCASGSICLFLDIEKEWGGVQRIEGGAAVLF